jgi:hypothetical protein
MESEQQKYYKAIVEKKATRRLQGKSPMELMFDSSFTFLDCPLVNFS